ncbi:MAG: MBL fold metallo-hydrolase [Clostridia bacterium]|nr:MBL fold metallo-hydrolase [Clostridia bacterium]
MSLKLTTFSPSMVYANCYILKDEASGEALVVDPGAYNQCFENMLRQEGITSLKYILLTHGHFDHIGGIKKLKAGFGGEIVIHGEDEACLQDGDKSLASGFGFEQNSVKADKILCDGDELALGDFSVRVIHTPGHTRGSVCYAVSDMIFSGDTLFKGTVGRTDFPGGSFDEIVKSLSKLAFLEGDYKVYPGHDVSTTLERERRYNPYMKGI